MISIDQLVAYQEEYFSLCWSYDYNTQSVLMCAAGYLGLIKVIDVTKQTTHRIIYGHGGSINELQAHDSKPHLVLSCSKVAIICLEGV